MSLENSVGPKCKVKTTRNVRQEEDLEGKGDFSKKKNKTGSLWWNMQAYSHFSEVQYPLPALHFCSQCK
jgi:hypothetical protein